MDPLLLALLLAVGLPVLVLAALGVCAATADYAFVAMQVRGGQLRGAVASALVKILVAETRTFSLPLVVELRKVGIFGAATPIIGGATVRDLEWRIRVDGQHVSTIKEAGHVRIGSFDQVVRLPVDAVVHLPEGLVKTLLRLRRTRAAGAEVLVEVEGHVVVRYWGLRRSVPVRETQWVVLGDALPALKHVRWTAGKAGHASLAVSVASAYRGEVLDGTLVVQVRRVRRMRRDPVLAAHEVPLRLAPGAAFDAVLDLRLEAPLDDGDPWPLAAHVLWQGERLRVEADATPDAPEADDVVLDVVPARAPPGAPARAMLVARVP